MLSWLFDLICPPTEPPKRTEPITHDLSKRHGGNDHAFFPISKDGHRGKTMGWRVGIQKDDFLILQNGGHTTRYQVLKIKYFKSPPDMFSATVVFSPRGHNK